MVCCWAGFAQQHNQQQLEKLNQAFHYIRNNYVDEIDLEPLVEEAIDAALKELDPHSSYLTRDEFMYMHDGINGEFSGIGISFITLRDTVIITRIIEGAPSQRAGLKKNDRILSIDGTSLVGIKRAEAAELLRGKKGSIATLSLLRNGETKTIDVERGDIPTKAISAAYTTTTNGGQNIAYLHVDSFLSKTTTEEFCNAIEALDAKPDGLIIDLRGNAGGLLPSAVQFSELFLKRGETIVTIESRKTTTTYQASKTGAYANIPVVLLIDEETASASEIVAGALQDHDRAIIIGRRSFGKGLVQKLVKFKDESGMKLTIARYKTPSGRTIQRPYHNGAREEYVADTERYSPIDTASIPDSLIFRTLHEGRKVYGGGGISPDIYIPADTTLEHVFTRVMLENGIVQRVIIDLLDRMPIDEFMSHYPTIEKFEQEFALDTWSLELMTRLVTAVDPTAASDKKGVAESAAIIEAQLAEEVFGEGLYHKIQGNKNDKAYIRAHEIIEVNLFHKNTLSPISRLIE